MLLKLSSRGVLKMQTSEITQEQLVESHDLLTQLVQEAKDIIDDADGYDALFDFVLGIAGLDGDPEYQ